MIIDSYGRKNVTDSKLKSLLQEYDDVFHSELPSGLTPERSVDHEIIIDPDGKIPYRDCISYHLMDSAQLESISSI